MSVQSTASLVHRVLKYVSEPIVLKQKSHDKLGDSAIGSDLTEDVELNNQKLPQERCMYTLMLFVSFHRL